MDKRNIVSLKKIENLSPHPNADRLEIAKIGGWNIIVGKNCFSIGEEVIFFEIDALIPVSSEWISEDLRKKLQNNKRDEYYRLRTLKLRDLISQGLIIAKSDIPNLDFSSDISEQLGVKRYKIKIDDFIPKDKVDVEEFPMQLFPRSHEARLQSYPEKLERLRGSEYFATLKIDGTSASYYYDKDKDELVVCSRNQVKNRVKNIETPTKCVYTLVAENYKLYNLLKKYPNLAIQGEIYGEKINCNLLRIRGIRFAVFHIFEIGNTDYNRAMTFSEMANFCQFNSLEIVPLVEHGMNLPFDITIDEIIAKSKGKYPGTNKDREGLVWRNSDNTISFKVINNDYLLKSK